MTDYILTTGTSDDIEFVVSKFLQSDTDIQNCISSLGISQEDSQEIQKKIAKEVIAQEINPENYASSSGEETNYQLLIGSSPYTVSLQKNILKILACVGLGLFEILGEADPLRKLVIISIAVKRLIQTVKDSISKIKPEHYCVYMFCQKCAYENPNGIISIKKLQEEMQQHKCKGWPVYPSNEVTICAYYDEAHENCLLFTKNRKDSLIAEAVHLFRTKGIITPVGEDMYRFSI